jgi:hypothetical protein
LGLGIDFVVISKKAVAEFLERPMMNSNLVKGASSSKLDKLLFDEGIEFTTPPRQAQKACFLLGWKYPRYLFLMGTGGGKSYLCLSLFSNKKRVGEVSRMLVLVPNTVNLGSWELEVDKHAKELSCVAVDGTGSEARWSQVESGADVTIITYQGLAALVAPIVSNKRTMDYKLVDRLGKQFDILVADEITAIKNPKSLWFRIIRRMRKSVTHIYGLTGTPFDKNPIDLWSQFFAIDGGDTLGETLGMYRQAFFTEKPNYWGGVEYLFRNSMREPLARRLANRSIRYSDEECQDLPGAVGGLSQDWMLVPVQLPMDQRPYYMKVRDDLRASHGDYQIVDNAYTRMRMLCSGWLGAKSETGEKVEIVFPKNPIFDAAIDLLERIPKDEKVILVGWFNTTCKLLLERVKKAKHTVGLINGTTTGTSKKATMKSFMDPKGIRVLIASTAISKGVNLQTASRYMVFVESPDSAIERTQLEARIRREGGSGKPCYFYDLVARIGNLTTVQDSILESLKTGRALHDVLIDQKEAV